MRHINRLATPDILVRKHDEWQSAFLEAYNNGKVKRPDHSKYAHQQIVDTLNAMSFNKTIYHHLYRWIHPSLEMSKQNSYNHRHQPVLSLSKYHRTKCRTRPPLCTFRCWTIGSEDWLLEPALMIR